MGVEQVGFYNAAIPIVALLGIFPDLFIQLFFPLINREYSSNNNPKIIQQLSKQVSKWIFIFNLPLFLLIFIFPGAIINLLFGAQYLVAENALRILIFGGFFSSLIALSSSLISMTGRSKLVLSNIMALTIFNVILNILLIPQYGLEGAAMATTISWILFSIIYFLEIRFFLSFLPIRRKMIKILFISLIPTGLLVYIKQFLPINLLTLILLGGTFFLTYLFLIFITNCLDKNDLMILNTIKKKYLNKII